MNMIEMKTAQYTYCVFEIVIVATTPHYDKEQVSDVCHREIKLGITTSRLDYNSDNREIWFSDLLRVKSDVRQENRPSIEPQRELESRGCKKNAQFHKQNTFNHKQNIPNHK